MADALTPVRWGIMGTGTIASDFVQVLKQLPGTVVTAVGSRSAQGAERFAAKWGIPTRHESYEALAADADLDVVYVATPSQRHPQDCRLCLEAGKAVLCEKTMAPSADAAEEVLELAQARGLLFIHGVWSRFFPAMQALRRLLDDGAIGEVRSARASFCQRDGAGSCSALLETGIYCAQFLQWALGETATVRGAIRMDHPSGVDTHVGALLEFPESRMGTFECSLGHVSDRSATVYGSEGVIEVSYPFWCPTEFKVTRMSGPGSQKWVGPENFQFPLPQHVEALPVSNPADSDTPDVPGFTFVNSQGLYYEAEEMNRCFREGLTESPKFSSSACLSVLRIISDIDVQSRL